MSIPRGVKLVLLAWCLVALGCGPEDARPGLPLAVPPTEVTLPAFTPAPPDASAVRVVGRITFEKIRVVNTQGQIQPRTISVEPLRFVDVEVRNAAGVTISTTASTSANGDFVLAVPANTDFFPTVLASTVASAGRFNAEVRPPTASAPLFSFRFVSNLQTGAPFRGQPAGSTVNLNLDPLSSATPAAGGTRNAAVANILDAAFVASEAVRTVNNNVSLQKVTFFYDGGSPLGSFFTFFGPNDTQPSIFVKGGNDDQDDTDPFDDAVIQHEYGHFTFSQISRDPSLGGEHGLSDLVYATLAYSEGLANWFAAAVAKIPAYFDTLGITGTSTQIFLFNMETRGTQNFTRGRESEATVSELLWDLADGVEGRTSTDGDATTLTLQQVFTALGAFRTSVVYVVVDDLLQQLITQGAVSLAVVQQLLLAPENQNLTLAARDAFPVTLPRPGVASDQCSTIAALFGDSSGINTANRFFKFDLAAVTNNVSISIQLGGGVNGTSLEGTNIDLFLLDANNNRLASSETQTSFESILVPSLPAGRYYIHVSGRPSPFIGEIFPNVVERLVDYQVGLQ